MKRTTLTLDDDLLRRLKETAARQGRTMGELVNDLLRHALAATVKPGGFKLDLQGWEAEVQAGVDVLDRDKLFDLMDGR